MIHDIRSIFPVTVRFCHCACTENFSFAINNINLILLCHPHFPPIEVLFALTFYHFIYVPTPNEFSFIIVSLHFPNEYVKYILQRFQVEAKRIEDRKRQGARERISIEEQRHYPKTKTVREMFVEYMSFGSCIYTANSLQQFVFRIVLVVATENREHLTLFRSRYSSHNKRAHHVASHFTVRKLFFCFVAPVHFVRDSVTIGHNFGTYQKYDLSLRLKYGSTSLGSTFLDYSSFALF